MTELKIMLQHALVYNTKHQSKGMNKYF